MKIRSKGPSCESRMLINDSIASPVLIFTLDSNPASLMFCLAISACFSTLSSPITMPSFPIADAMFIVPYPHRTPISSAFFAFTAFAIMFISFPSVTGTLIWGIPLFMLLLRADSMYGGSLMTFLEMYSSTSFHVSSYFIELICRIAI